ncbi:MAG: TIGR03936 family radical SAM-associated protein, partial [Peptococcaceae bacterium]
DMELTEDMPLTQVKAALDQAMPPAFEVTALKVVQGKTPSLMSIITRARYQLWLEFVAEVTQAQLDDAVEQFWNREEIVVYRYKKNSKDKKPVNIRPGVYQIELGADGNHATLQILVQSGNEGNVRPEEVAYGLMSAGMPPVQSVVRIHRDGLYLLDEKENLITPLDVV